MLRASYLTYHGKNSMALDIETVREIKRLIDKKINNISEQIIYGSIDNYEKLQYSRGQISSLSQLKEDLSELLRDEE